MATLLIFTVGVALALVSRLLDAFIRDWRMRRREGSGLTEQIQEPSLAELLAETGWRINPKESDRELARRAIPLIVVVMIALLFLMVGHSLSWLLLGFVAGRVFATALQRSHQRHQD